MSTLEVEVEDDLLSVLGQLDQPVPRAVKELIVLELYRRGMISGGKAGQLLGMSRHDFIVHASNLGIPYLQMKPDEWEAERKRSEEL